MGEINLKCLNEENDILCSWIRRQMTEMSNCENEDIFNAISIKFHQPFYIHRKDDHQIHMELQGAPKKPK